MNKIKHLPKTIPSKDFEFSIDVQGTLSSEKYVGSFKCKIPSLKEQAQIAKYKAFLNGGLAESLDKSIVNLHHMVAYCRFTVTQAPEWFVETDYGYDLFDQNVVEEVYHKILKFEEEWLETVWGKKEDAAAGQQG